MKTFLLILSLFILFFSCQFTEGNSKHSEVVKDGKINNSKLFVTTKTRIGINGSEKDSSVVSIINTEYFEVNLASLANEPKFIATKTIENSYTSERNYKFVEFTISNEFGVSKKYKTTTEFLNFMSEKGYEMVSQIRNKYSVDYTFKKK